jgi:hypothetical protein
MEPNVLTRLKRVAGKQTTTLTGWGASRGCNKNWSCGKVRQPRKPGCASFVFTALCSHPTYSESDTFSCGPSFRPTKTIPAGCP